MSGFGALGQFALGQQVATDAAPSSVTWDPANKDVEIGLSNGNLTATCQPGGSGYASVRATLPYTDGDHIFEIIVDAYLQDVAVGFATSAFTFGSGNWIGITNASIGYYSGAIWLNSINVASAATFTTGDKISARYTAGVSNDIRFYKNDVLTATVTSGFAGSGAAVYPAVSLRVAGDSQTANFVTPTLPSGALPWGTVPGGEATSDDNWFWWHFGDDAASSAASVTANIVGVASPTQPGNLTTLSSYSVILTGIPGAGGVGSLSVQTATSISVPIVAQGAVGLAGSITQAGQLDVPELGLINEAGEGLINEAGEFLTYAEPTSVGVDIPAVTANSQAGSPQGVPIVNATANPTTVSASGAPGTPTVTAVRFASVTLESASSGGEAGQAITLQSGLVLIPSASAVAEAGLARIKENVSVSLNTVASAGLASPLVPVASYIVTLEILTDETLPTVFAVEMYPALVT